MFAPDVGQKFDEVEQLITKAVPITGGTLNRALDVLQHGEERLPAWLNDTVASAS